MLLQLRSLYHNYWNIFTSLMEALIQKASINIEIIGIYLLSQNLEVDFFLDMDLLEAELISTLPLIRQKSYDNQTKIELFI